MYILEGNIGTGKSTFLKMVSLALPEVSISFEPIDHWQTENTGQSLLEHFYRDSQRWAYTMETIAMTCRVREHMLDQEYAHSFRIIERSVYSGHYCFALNGYRHGFFSDLEWQLYEEVFSFLIPGRCKPPHGFIYLRTDPVVSFERMSKRNRGAESTVPLEYLQQIHACHDDFLLKKKKVLSELVDVPVLVLDVTKDFEEDPVVFEEHVNKIKAFLQQTSLACSPVARSAMMSF